MNNYKHNTGFTLIEIAIVLLIISVLGILVLKGAGLIPSAQTKDLIKISQDLSIAVGEFKDRYHYYPGDLPVAGSGTGGSDIPNLASACNITTATANIGNGRIDNNTESDCVIEELFESGFLENETAPITRHYFDTEITVRVIHQAATTFSNSGTTYPQSIEHIVEYSNLPLEAAQRIDTDLDDGDLTTGKVQANNATADPVPLLAVPL